MIMATRSLFLASLLAVADAASKAAPRKSALDIAAEKAARGAEYIDPFIVMGTEKELQKRLDWMAAANQVAVVSDHTEMPKLGFYGETAPAWTRAENQMGADVRVQFVQLANTFKPAPPIMCPSSLPRWQKYKAEL